jgi:hypothetical protein
LGKGLRFGIDTVVLRLLSGSRDVSGYFEMDPLLSRFGRFENNSRDFWIDDDVREREAISGKLS